MLETKFEWYMLKLFYSKISYMYRKSQPTRDKNLRKLKVEEKYNKKKDKLDLRMELINQIVELDTKNENNRDVKEESHFKKKKYEEYKSLKDKRIESKQLTDLQEKLCIENEIEESTDSDDSDVVKVFKYNELKHVNSDEQNSEESNAKEPYNSLVEQIDRVFNMAVKVFKRREEVINFRKTLPIFYEESQIISSIRENKITVISGGTGSGKSTQIPQFLLENGFKNILITQPRRIAAISLCERLNYELNGDYCGYKIMHESNIKKHHKIQILTDGVLLNKLREDTLLSKTEVIIIDEFHERNINIDLLVPLIKDITEKRSLKLILMSATMNFQLHFEYEIVNIESNGHRVFLNWGDSSDYLIQTEKIIEKLLKTEQVGDMNINNEKSHILVFLPSKRDIYTLKHTLSKYENKCCIFPLHSNLNTEEQQNVFKESSKRKIILSTNIAETSLTITGVVYVIDTGLEKNKVYEDGVVEYKTEFISKSSAIQRMGRAGRERSGICYRTYSHESYLKMEDTKLPKILTDSFDEGLLFLKSIGYNKPSSFNFLLTEKQIISKMSSKIKISEEKLKDLGAIDSIGKITQVGMQMSKIPMDCRFSRILCSSELTQELLLVIGVISSNIDILINTKYIYEESDFIAQTLTAIDGIKSDNKLFSPLKRFINYYKLNIEEMKFNNEIKKHILKTIYKGFCDQLCIKHDEVCYIFKGEVVFLDKKSVKIDSEYIVFNSLVKGKTRTYLKGVSRVDPSWF